MDKNKKYGRADSSDRRLFYLNELDDYKVHHNDPDVRGWKVVADGREIGEIDNLIADVHKNKVRYLDVEVNDSLASSTSGSGTPLMRDNRRESLRSSDSSRSREDGSPHMLIPIGMARVDSDNKTIQLDSSVDLNTLQSCPRHQSGETITPVYEVDVYNTLVGPTTNPGMSSTPKYDRGKYVNSSSLDDDFYNNQYFSEDRAFGSSSQTSEERSSGWNSSSGSSSERSFRSTTSSEDDRHRQL